MSKELKRHSVRGVKYNGEEICGGFAYYDADDVDALLAEKDAAIAELKDKCQMHDFFWEGCGFAKRGFKNTIAVSEAFDRLEAENAELKKKLMPCLNGDCILTCDVVEKYGKENAELKAEIESLKASHYAEMVDAGMRERRLRRALWLARAERAIAESEYWYGLCSGMYYINAMEVPDEEDNPYKRVKDTNIGWYKTWMKVERKCRAKAEEYK